MADDVVILFVPGIRPKPRVADHQAQLRRCLAHSLARVGLHGDAADDVASRLHVVGWSHGFYGEHSDIEADLPGIERLLSEAGDVYADVREARSWGRRLTGWMFALADWFPILGTYFSTRRMKTRVGEINRYFEDDSGESTAARHMLRDALEAAWARQQRVVLLGHSFGSVIAYDTLWEYSRSGGSERVGLFISMGSPLTMHYINKHLKGAHHHGLERYPACIDRWINLAAIGEVTALDRKLSHRFAPMQGAGLVHSIEDDLRLINRFRGADGLNVHKCYGYMASDELARVLQPYLDT